MVRQNSLINFEKDYFDKYKRMISSLILYKKLETIIDSYEEYKLKFDYYEQKVYRKRYYFVSVGVYDKENKLVEVPDTSIYYDTIYNLIAGSSVLYVNLKNNEVTELELDKEELDEDLSRIILYLKR